MKDVKFIEVCLGVGMGQIFPETTRIIIEDETEEVEEDVKPKKRVKKVKSVDTEIGKEFMMEADLTVLVENPKRVRKKKDI
jgi:hypothetical protein